LRAICGPAGLAVCIMLAACATSGSPTELAATSPAAPGAASSPQGAPDRRSQVKVALIVPLSAHGQSGIIGKSLKQAGELALFERDSPNVQLMVKDDKGTPEGARAAVDEAIKGGARLILGPLFAKSVAAVAPLARQADISIVAFSNDRQVARNGVYLLSFQPAPEVTRVVAYATQQGKRRFAALIPDDAFGKIVSASFTDAVSSAGGTVVAMQTYPQPASAAGLLEPLRRISTVIQAASEAGAPIEALFLPGGQENLDVIARLMPQAEIDTQKVKVLGTGGMDYPNAGREANLVGAWYAAPEPSGWSDFSQRYAKTYGSAPPRIASLAYDAVSLAIAVSGSGEEQPIGPAQLTRSSGFTGIDGAFRLLADGGTDRSLAILEVQKFGVGVIDPPPALGSGPPAATSSLPRGGTFNLNFN
jgi:ABC-type branched-subunit amino acid transport system substrate-binding protein